MRDLGDGPRGVAVFVCQLLSARRFFKKERKKRSATTQQLHRTLRSLDDVCLSCLFATQLRGKKKLLAAKGQKIMRCNSVISGSANSSHSYSYNFTSTPSPVTARLYSTFSKQLNDQPFAQFKAVDFALVVSTFKPLALINFWILTMPLTVRCVSQADLSRFFFFFWNPLFFPEYLVGV